MSVESLHEILQYLRNFLTGAMCSETVVQVPVGKGQILDSFIIFCHITLDITGGTNT